jgi:uncharacterized damage-inducible protein DinB
MENLKAANCLALGQLIDLLNLLPEEVYQTRLTALHNHSVGQHVRHIIEFYQCLLASPARGRVCYDARARDPRIEGTLAYALECAHAQVEQLTGPLADTALWIESHTPAEAQASSLARELSYLVEHTVHHLAMIKIGLDQHFPDLGLPAELGVAPSTLRYRAAVAAG